jgi:hypothetical protein
MKISLLILGMMRKQISPEANATGRCCFLIGFSQRLQGNPLPGGPIRFMALCSTGALDVDFPPLKAGPKRLLAGAAEAEAASRIDRANANRLAIRVVFIMLILVFSWKVFPFGWVLSVIKHRLQ